MITYGGKIMNMNNLACALFAEEIADRKGEL